MRGRVGGSSDLRISSLRCAFAMVVILRRRQAPEDLLSSVGGPVILRRRQAPEDLLSSVSGPNSQPPLSHIRSSARSAREDDYSCRKYSNHCGLNHHRKNATFPGLCSTSCPRNS